MNDPRNTHPWWNRRDFFKTGAALAAGAYGLGWRAGHADEIPQEFDGSKFQLKAPEPNPKSGGVLRYGIMMRPPHFDVHQSGTVNNIGSQGCMFDNLIRRDPRDSGKTIIPDLAHSWEIAEDGKTYTFHLRRGVEFHDGAELTAEDVKATFDRIAKPPPGISIPRSVLFKAVSEISARDKYTVEFKLSEPRPINFMMSAIASGWNVILRKKTLEDHKYDLRRVEIYPGTGPFKSARRAENEVWVMEKNKNYWNKGLPYLDGIEFYNAMSFSPELGSAILSGRVDYVRLTDPVTARKAAATPGLSTAAFNQSVVHATCVNNRKKPFDDPRVRRALHLALDRPALIETVKDVAPMQVGGFIYPFSEFATPKTELEKRLGYQPDPAASIKEARALLAASGHGDGLKGVDFLVRDGVAFKIWAQAIQAMLLEELNIHCDLRTVSNSVWFEDPRAEITASRWVSSCRPCSTPRTTSPPGTAPAGRRTTVFGTTRNSTASPSGSIARSTPRSVSRWYARPRRSWKRTRRCCRSPGKKSTTSGTTTSRAITLTTISAYSTWCGSIRCGSTRREGGPVFQSDTRRFGDILNA